MDQLRIQEISGAARIGVTEQERRHPQKVLVDVVLFLELEAAANTDDLTLSIDYCHVVEIVLQIVQARPYALLESLTRCICERLLGNGRIVSVQVQVQKFPEALQQSAKAVAVRMKRPGRRT